MVIAAVQPTAGLIVTDYAWCRAPELRTGELRVTTTEGLISRLVVTFD